MERRIPSQAKGFRTGDTNSEQDICIPAIYVIVVTLDLNLSIQKTMNNIFPSLFDLLVRPLAFHCAFVCPVPFEKGGAEGGEATLAQKGVAREVLWKNKTFL